MRAKESKLRQMTVFKQLLASHYLKFKPKSMALLYSAVVQIMERDTLSRLDVEYPFDRKDTEGNVIERMEKAPSYEVSFYYQRSKTKGPMFRIFAIRTTNYNE
jgi:hypothetical protein